MATMMNSIFLDLAGAAEAGGAAASCDMSVWTRARVSAQSARQMPDRIVWNGRKLRENACPRGRVSGRVDGNPSAAWCPASAGPDHGPPKGGHYVSVTPRLQTSGSSPR